LAWKISFAKERGSVVKKVWKKLGQIKVNRILCTLGFIKLPEKGENFPSTFAHQESFTDLLRPKFVRTPLEEDELENHIKSSNTKCHLAEIYMKNTICHF